MGGGQEENMTEDAVLVIRQSVRTFDALCGNIRECTKKCFIAEKKKDATYIVKKKDDEGLWTDIQDPNFPSMNGYLVYSFVQGGGSNNHNENSIYTALKLPVIPSPVDGSDKDEVASADNFTTLEPVVEGTMWSLKSVRKALEDVILREFTRETSRTLTMSRNVSSLDAHRDGNCYANR